MANLGIDEYDAVVSSIYQSSLEVGDTPDALQRIAALVGCTGASLIRIATSGEILEFHAYNHSSAAQSDYGAHYHRVDPGVQWIATAAVGELGMDTAAFDARNPAHREYVYDFCYRHNIRYVAGLKTLQTPDSLTLISLQRGAGMPAFRENGELLLNRIRPHLVRAALLQAQLGTATTRQGLAESALDKLAAAVFVVTQSGRVMFVNRAGEDLASARDMIHIRDGFLGASSANLGVRLRDAVARACTAPTSASAFSHSAFRAGQLQLHVTPIGGRQSTDWLGSGHYAMVVVATSTGTERDADLLQSLLGVTPAESRLVTALVHGESVQDIGARTGTSILTLRSQLASVFNKTGVRSQGQLISLVSRLPKLRE